MEYIPQNYKEALEAACSLMDQNIEDYDSDIINKKTLKSMASVIADEICELCSSNILSILNSMETEWWFYVPLTPKPDCLINAIYQVFTNAIIEDIIKEYSECSKL